MSCRSLFWNLPASVTTVSILTMSLLFLEVIFLSLSLSWFILGSVSPYGGTASIWVWIQHQLFTSKQRKAVCWQILWVLGRELRNLPCGWEPLKSRILCLCTCYIESWSQPYMVVLLFPEHFLRSYFVPGTVLVVRDIDNSSHLLSFDCARNSLRAGAITTLIFIDKTEPQENWLSQTTNNW